MYDFESLFCVLSQCKRRVIQSTQVTHVLLNYCSDTTPPKDSTILPLFALCHTLESVLKIVLILVSVKISFLLYIYFLNFYPSVGYIAGENGVIWLQATINT